MKESHDDVILVEEIYELIDERAEGIKKAVIEEIRQKQDEDLRYINQRIDSLNQRIDSQGSQLNQRMDTIMQMLMDMNRQLVEIAKQK